MQNKSYIKNGRRFKINGMSDLCCAGKLEVTWMLLYLWMFVGSSAQENWLCEHAKGKLLKPTIDVSECLATLSGTDPVLQHLYPQEFSRFRHTFLREIAIQVKDGI